MQHGIFYRVKKSLIAQGLDRGGRNRTLLWSFGDSYSTDELHPFIINNVINNLYYTIERFQMQ